MPIGMAEFDGTARVLIDGARCDGCGRCLQVCRGGALYQGESRIEVEPGRLLGCFACGQCVAVCPREAIRVEGRGLSADDIAALPDKAQRADYAQLTALLQARRSCRVFRPEPVPLADVHRILEAARTAPVSLPPSGVGVLMLHGFAEVQAFRRALVGVISRRRWLFRAPVVWLWRPFMNRAQWRLLRTFVGPVLEVYLGLRPELPPGEDSFFYRAPLAYVFYGSSTSEPADAVIAATHAMLAAEALGYGTCFLGFPAHLLGMDARVKEDYGIPRKARPGIALIVGHPGVPAVRSVRRHFAREDWLFNGPFSPFSR